MKILGLSALAHDTAAALIEGGVIKAAIEESKLARSRPRGLPEAAIQFCLAQSGIGWQDLDAVVVASQPVRGWFRRALLRARISAVSPLSSAYYELNELGQLAHDLNQFRILRHNEGASRKVLAFEHHLCHAASAFYLSPFERALIITLDEEGDGKCGMVALGEGTEIRVLRTIAFPHSLGWAYSQITSLLGFIPHLEEHKTQWLSLEGEPSYKNVLLEMLRDSHSPLPRLNHGFVNYGVGSRLTLSSKFYERIDMPNRGRDMVDEQRRALASSVQHACFDVVSEIIERYSRREGVTHVCLGGGVFQNALLVSMLEEKFGLNQVFVPPAPGNSGCALGGALLLWHGVMQQPRQGASDHVCWGPAYRGQEIKDILDNSKSRYFIQNTEACKIDVTVQLLQSGKIVGWFQGATEFGPRALGNRSLLASPWAPYVKENLNDYIKHREWFRPFAVAIPEEDCSRYFECSQLCRFMNSLGWVRPSRDGLPQSFYLPGNRLRLQVVNKQSNLLFWRLLKRFGELAPAPMLLNTSFNLAGEPLVAKPQDAVRSYFCSGLDALLIENFLLAKTSALHLLAGTRASSVAV